MLLLLMLLLWLLLLSLLLLLLPLTAVLLERCLACMKGACACTLAACVCAGPVCWRPVSRHAVAAVWKARSILAVLGISELGARTLVRTSDSCANPVDVVALSVA